MRKQNLVIIISILLMSVGIAKSQRTTSSRKIDLVLEIPKLEYNKSFEGLRQQLKKIKGVEVEGFCKSEKLLYLRFDGEQYFNVLVAVNEAGFVYYVKKEATLTAGIAACNDKKELYLRESSSIE